MPAATSEETVTFALSITFDRDLILSKDNPRPSIELEVSAALADLKEETINPWIDDLLAGDA